ncbi:MAG: hypothetical protein ACRDIY_01915 [Chloroflexota bacterium]
MIGTLPVSDLMPLDYRYALDAATSLLSAAGPSFVLCQADELLGEVRQRIPRWATKRDAAAVLWVEPAASGWEAEAETFGTALPENGLLVIVMSRPLARLIPERRTWARPAIGLQIGGVERVRRAIGRAGFRLEASHGIHSAMAIALSLVGQQCARAGHPALGDRLHFAARRRYRVTGLGEGLATVSLLIARKGAAWRSR